jgi:hypothetical protein
MTFCEAAHFRMPFGKHIGETLDAIAEADDGLEYLDWLRGQRQGRHEPIDEALAAYLDDPAIAREVRDLLEDTGA